ncbi:MAG TPA: hypothetical protein VJW76_00390 [Verrucomicrobiae bacterium]|nr:hypothetical protein [Verrucomicrobiae bacterium]
MNQAKLYKAGLVLALVPLLVLASFTQARLNRDRVAMGITRGEVLGKTAPPVLVFTTVALGGFRGLIANALWVRAMELQDEGKYFEKVQLTDWITKLQPHFITVWVVQAWDMAYNISIKFDDPRDRWQWVLRGIELLRDEALKYNPDETLIYRELAWIFQHKMGADLDDAHMYFKSQWAREMDAVLQGTNYPALIHPGTDDEKERARILREKYKLDPNHMKEVDEEFGPLEWRLPESQAVYWATFGLKRAKQQDRITLRRAIYQPMQLAFQRGRLIEINVGTNKAYQFGPNLAMIPRANKAYEKMAEADPEYRDHIRNAHKNFLKDAVYFLFSQNRRAEAGEWKNYLTTSYPDVTLFDVRDPHKPQEKIADMTVEDYAAARVTEDVGETSNVRVRAAIEGLLVSSFYNLAIGEDDAAINYALFARKVWDRFMAEIGDQKKRVGLAPFSQMEQEAQRVFESEYNEDIVNRYRTKRGLPPRTNEPPANPAPPP